MRSVNRAFLILLAGLAACLDKGTVPAGDGVVAVIMPASNIDSGHVIVLSGATVVTTVSAAPGATVTIPNIAVGTYTLGLEGFSGGAVKYYGQVTGVTVTAGGTTNATAGAFPVIQPAIIAMPTYTNSGQFQLIFSKIASAASYVVQRDTLASFATSKDTSIAATDTNVTVGAPTTKTYNVRVLAIDPAGGRGLASIARAIQTVTSVTIAPSKDSINPGQTKQFTATAKDGSGATVSGLTVAWESHNQAVATVDTTGLATGVAGGTAVITATALGIPGNATLKVLGGVATQVAYSTQPSNATAGAAINPAIEVEIRDVNGNRVATARNPVTLAISAGPGGSTLLGTTTVNAINGVASFSGINIEKAGSGYQLSAASSSLTGATSSSFTISPGAASSLAFTAQPTDTDGNVVMAPAVTVTILDAFGNVVTSASNNVTVAIGNNPWASVFSTGGTLSGTTTQAAASGVATFSNLKIDKPGSGYTMVASAGALTKGTSAPFNIKLRFSSLSSGAYDTCGITPGGTYCWGDNGNGQLGSTTGNTYSDSVPALVNGGLTFTQVSVGNSFACAITGAGAGYCWGYNGNGQIGDGTTTPRSVPTAVTMPGGATFTQISAGYSHACARANTGAAYCWGYNANGRLGDASTTQRPVPTLVAGGLSFTSVTAGGLHTCGTTTAASNNGYCWGYNYYGELGNNAALPGADVTSPGLIAGAFTYASLTAGYLHTCGLLTTLPVNGNGKCWGYNNQGQVGNNASLPGANVASPVDVNGSVNWAGGISAGYYHTCGVTATKAAYCWGNDGNNQLGDGGTTNQSAPVGVSGLLLFDVVRSGQYHTCGLVGTTGYCWGYNGSGQLGTGSTVNKAVPTRIVQ